MKVFVAGGTGAIGRPTVRALVAAGHEVKALARSPAKAKLVAGLGALPVDVSLFDSTALAAQIKGFDAVINLATALPNSRDFHRASAWRENFRVRSAGSAAIAASMLATGVPRLVQESVSMIYCDGGCRWVDETWSVDDFPAAASNHAAEAQARAFAKQGGTEIILRFGWFYGPGAAHSEQFLTLARRWGICVMLGPGDTYLSSIHVDDGARAVEAALDLPGGVYNVVDDLPLTKRDYADAIAVAAGRRHYVRAPGRLALLMGNGTTSLTRSLRVSNAKLREASSWRPAFPDARKGWEAMARDVCQSSV